jgi:hypothetical protein
VNLQVANLMANYDLPWNPSRIEQRRVVHTGRAGRAALTQLALCGPQARMTTGSSPDSKTTLWH